MRLSAENPFHPRASIDGPVAKCVNTGGCALSALELSSRILTDFSTSFSFFSGTRINSSPSLAAFFSTSLHAGSGETDRALLNRSGPRGYLAAGERSSGDSCGKVSQVFELQLTRDSGAINLPGVRSWRGDSIILAQPCNNKSKIILVIGPLRGSSFRWKSTDPRERPVILERQWYDVIRRGSGYFEHRFELSPPYFCRQFGYDRSGK
ncbi:uncharacterized protein BDV17DRAFT_85102 [Aspergillus undulatus]|uniref:uncharacterized protein n=1 Tax=Aspergillus undulatus TaxID=1810928 RepID=UPI003CCCF76A